MWTGGPVGSIKLASVGFVGGLLNVPATCQCGDIRQSVWGHNKTVSVGTQGSQCGDIRQSVSGHKAVSVGT